MKIHETHIDVRHIDLIKVFFTANELHKVNVTSYNKVEVVQDLNVVRSLVQLSYDELDLETSNTLAFMSLRHLGMGNMLDDFLIKCGISPFSITPPILHSPPVNINADQTP